MAVRVQEAALQHLSEIRRYTRGLWGVKQADRYISELLSAFDRIESGSIASRPIPSEYGTEGFRAKCGRHYVYWRRLPEGDIGILAVLHEKMHQEGALRGG